MRVSARNAAGVLQKKAANIAKLALTKRKNIARSGLNAIEETWFPCQKNTLGSVSDAHFQR